jgi:hypothetical protein
VIGNVGTKASFRIGTTDAEFLEKQFQPVFNAPDLENLPNRNAVMALLVDGVPARPFTIETLAPRAKDYSRIDQLRELSYQTYGRDRADVEQEINERYTSSNRAAADNPFDSYL